MTLEQDSQIDAIVEKIEKFSIEIDVLRKKINPKWETSGNLEIVGCNVKKISVADKNDVISAIAFLLRIKVSFIETFQFLEIEPIVKQQFIGSYCIDDFLSDLKKRFQTLDLKEKEERLIKMKNFAESFESTDRKRNKALEGIMKELNEFSVK